MKSKASIRKKVGQLFIFLAVSPIILIGSLLSWQTYSTQKLSAINLQSEISKRAISEISSISIELSSIVKNLAGITNLSDKSPNEQQKIISQINALSFRKIKNIFNEITLINHNGEEIVKIKRLKNVLQSELISRQDDLPYSTAVNERKVYFGRIIQDIHSGESTLVMALPLINKRTGEVSHVLRCTIRLNFFLNSIIEEKTSHELSVFITDAQGVVISHDDPSIVLAKNKIIPFDNGMITSGFYNENVIQVSNPFTIGSQMVYLVSHYHAHDALSKAMTSFIIVGVFSIIFLVVSFIAVYKAFVPIISNIEHLTEVSVAVTNGELGKKAVISGEDELAILANTVNSMTTMLVDDIERKRLAEIALSNARDELEDKVALRTKELSELNLQLKYEITRKEQTEGDLQEAHDELELRVAQRTMALATANTALKIEMQERIRLEKEHEQIRVKALTQNKLATIGEISTGVAHEINQPLSFIKIIFESTIRDLNINQLDSSELLEDCQESLRQVDRISAIITHLRTFGRADTLSVSEVCLNDIWKNTLVVFGERIRLSNVTISEEFPEKVFILGNDLKLEQLFINLLQNSLDAIKPKGKGEISLRIVKKENKAVAVFSDTGVGISAKVKSKIFEPFFTTKDVGEGTGLGLSISYGIVTEHKGTIEYQSVEGESTAFTICFPLTPKG